MAHQIYESVQPKSSNQPIKLDYEKTGVLGLQVPMARMTYALRTLRWNYGPKEILEINNGILLFGHNGCGEDAIIGKVLDGLTKSTKIYVNFLAAKGTAVKKFFDKAKDCTQAVMIIGNADEHFDDSDNLAVSTAVVEEMKKLKGNPNVYVIAFFNKPWKIRKEVLSVFGTKIYVPFPPGRAITQMLRNCVENVALSHNGTTLITEAEYEECGTNPNLKGITFQELQDVAEDAFSKACNRKLGYSLENMLSNMSVSQDDLRHVVVKKRELEEALTEVEVPLYRMAEERDFKTFIDKEGVPVYPEIEKETEEDVGYPPKDRENFCLTLFLSCFEGWC